jgi:magnesium-protoporphyrin IX monomethyl ester (oxidative) cyclase
VRDYFRLIDRWQPDAVAYSCNYLANVPEIIDLAKETRKRLPDSLIMVGGHSASFTAKELLEHAEGALDCILKGEGEPLIADVLVAAESDRKSLDKVPGVMTL